MRFELPLKKVNPILPEEMKIREFPISWKVPKLEFGENLNTRKLPDLQYYQKRYLIISIVGILLSFSHSFK